jgi:hypothetical protein
MSTNENLDVVRTCDLAEGIKIAQGNGLMAMNESKSNLAVSNRYWEWKICLSDIKKIR